MKINLNQEIETRRNRDHFESTPVFTDDFPAPARDSHPALSCPRTPSELARQLPGEPRESGGRASTLGFEDLVGRFYRVLYQFAFSLTRVEADACDLTQQTFYVWASKGRQLRDESKVKTWLFTTLHREFLQGRRRQLRFPHFELSQVEADLPEVSPARHDGMDWHLVVQALAEVDEVYQAPVALLYLEDCPYKEIARRLDVPLGTVKSRISRGIAQLRERLEVNFSRGPETPALNVEAAA